MHHLLSLSDLYFHTPLTLKFFSKGEFVYKYIEVNAFIKAYFSSHLYELIRSFLEAVVGKLMELLYTVANLTWLSSIINWYADSVIDCATTSTLKSMATPLTTRSVFGRVATPRRQNVGPPNWSGMCVRLVLVGQKRAHLKKPSVLHKKALLGPFMTKAVYLNAGGRTNWTFETYLTSSLHIPCMTFHSS